VLGRDSNVIILNLEALGVIHSTEPNKKERKKERTCLAKKELTARLHIWKARELKPQQKSQCFK
jgi:hypothetical protein